MNNVCELWMLYVYVKCVSLSAVNIWDNNNNNISIVSISLSPFRTTQIQTFALIFKCAISIVMPLDDRHRDPFDICSCMAFAIGLTYALVCILCFAFEKASLIYYNNWFIIIIIRKCFEIFKFHVPSSKLFSSFHGKKFQFQYE